jgi:DNA-binding NtrC family response regulator
VSKRRILVIDDEQIVLDSVSRILVAGYEVDTARSSPQGLQWALSREYDLVLTDIRMPEMGGMRILRELKRSRPAVPVVIITGYATVESAVRAIKLGAENYLEKPFTPDSLTAAVEGALRKASQHAPEPQELVHAEQVLQVLERAADDNDFVVNLFYQGAGALEEYDLTGAEKLAILTGDVKWIESYVGRLTPRQKRWLDQRLSAEIW